VLPKEMAVVVFFFLFFDGGAGDRTQDPAHATQVLYH
jgi:hypothetical protein